MRVAEAEARQPGRAAALAGGLAVRCRERRRRRSRRRSPRPASCCCVELGADGPAPPAAAVAAHRAAGGVSLALCAHADARGPVARGLARGRRHPDHAGRPGGAGAPPAEPGSLVELTPSSAGCATRCSHPTCREAASARILLAAVRRAAAAWRCSAAPTTHRVASRRGAAAGADHLSRRAPSSSTALAHREAVRSGDRDPARPDRRGARADRGRGSASRRCWSRRMSARRLALELPPQVELLPLPAPMPVARARLALALRIGGAACRAAPAAPRARRRPAARQPDRPLQSGRISRLSALHRRRPCADRARDRAAGTAQRERRLCRRQPCAGPARPQSRAAACGRPISPAHLGGGRFAVAVAAASRPQLERLRCRLEVTVAEGEPWNVLAAAEALRRRAARRRSVWRACSATSGGCGRPPDRSGQVLAAVGRRASSR